MAHGLLRGEDTLSGEDLTGEDKYGTKVAKKGEDLERGKFFKAKKKKPEGF